MRKYLGNIEKKLVCKFVRAYSVRFFLRAKNEMNRERRGIHIDNYMKIKYV